MEGMMRQMVMAGPRKSRIIEVSIPKYSDDEMLVKVTLTGMCHSELYPWATAKEGDIQGHHRSSPASRLPAHPVRRRAVTS